MTAALFLWHRTASSSIMHGKTPLWRAGVCARVCAHVCGPVHAAVKAQCTVNNVKRISWFLRVSLCAATYWRETCPRPGAFKRPRPPVRPLRYPGVGGKMMDSTSPGSFARHFSVAWVINSATHFPHPFVFRHHSRLEV